MKKILINVLLVLGVIATVTSCRREYLDTAPTSSVPASDVFTSIENARASLNGTYRAMYVRYNSQGEFGQGAMMINIDALADDYVMSTTGNGWYIGTGRWIDHRNENSGLTRYPYEFYYFLIDNANNIITKIDNVPNSTQADRNIIKGEALVIRAWSYFNLVRIYGKRYVPGNTNSQLGVSLVLTPTTPTTKGLARASVEEVYTQINADIDASIALLGSTRANKSHINKSVAQGIKARVALEQGKWNDAATNAIAARSGFLLMSNAQYLEGFSDYSNPEWMWGLKQPEDQSTFFAAFHSYNSCNYNSTNIRTNPKLINNLLYNTMSATDIRRKVFDPSGLALSGGSNYTSNPTVAITGGGGTGATATASTGGGSIVGFTITNPGSGYTSNPTVTITGGGGSGVVVFPVIVGGQLREILYVPAVTPPGGSRFPFMTQKFRLPGVPSTSVAGDVSLMRAAEMLLIEAEARAKQGGQEVAARQALFTLMNNRDPNYVLSANTGQALIDEILRHRRLELWGEGFRFFDLKRLDQPLNRNGANHTLAVAVIYDYPAGDKDWEFLIPRYELDANKLCVQNPL